MPTLPRRYVTPAARPKKQEEQERIGPKTQQELFEGFITDPNAAPEAVRQFPEPIREPALRFRQGVQTEIVQQEELDQTVAQERLERLRSRFEQDVDPVGFRRREIDVRRDPVSIQSRANEIAVAAELSPDDALDVAINERYEELGVPKPALGKVTDPLADKNAAHLEYMRQLDPHMLAVVNQRTEDFENTAAFEGTLGLGGQVGAGFMAWAAPFIGAFEAFDTFIVRPAAANALVGVAKAQETRSKGGFGVLASPAALIGDTVDALAPGTTASGQHLLQEFRNEIDNEGWISYIKTPHDNPASAALAKTEFPTGVVGTLEVGIDVAIPVLGWTKRGTSGIQAARKLTTKTRSLADVNRLVASGKMVWNADAARFVDLTKGAPNAITSRALSIYRKPLGLVRDEARAHFAPPSYNHLVTLNHGVGAGERVGIKRFQEVFNRDMALALGDDGSILAGPGTVATQKAAMDALNEIGEESFINRMKAAPQYAAGLIHSAEGAQAAANFAITAHRAADIDAGVLARMNEPLNRASRKVLWSRHYPKVFTGAVEARFSTRMLQIRDFYDALLEGAYVNTNKTMGLLKSQFDEAFGGKLPLNKISSSTFRAGRGGAKELETFYNDLDSLVTRGAVSQAEADRIRWLDVLQNKEDYVLTPAQGKVVDNVRRTLDSNNTNEELFFGITKENIEGIYVPQYWKKGLKTGKDDFGNTTLSERALESITITKRPHMKNRSFVDVRSAMRRNMDELDDSVAKNREPDLLLPSDEIRHPLDTVQMRLDSGAKQSADTAFNRMVDEQKLINPKLTNEADDMRTILSAGTVGTKTAEVARTIGFVPDVFRLLKLSWDLAVVGVQGFFGVTPQLLLNPPKTIQAVAMAGMTGLNPRRFNAWVAANADKVAKWQQAGLRNGQAILEQGTRGQGKTFLERGRFNPLRLINDAQFTRAMFVLKVQMAELNRDMLVSQNLYQKALKGTALGKGRTIHTMSDFEIHQQVARHINSVFGTGSTNMGLITRNLLKWPLLTPTFTKETLDLAIRPLAGGQNVDAALARSFWIRLVGTQAALGTLLSLTFGGKEMNVHDPSRSDWMVAKTGQDAMNVLGRFRAPVQTMFGLTEDVADLARGDLPRSEQGTGPVDIERLNIAQRLGRYYAGRQGVWLTTAQRLGSQRNFQGESLFDPEGDGTGFNWPTVAVAAKELGLPVTAQNILEDRAENRATLLSMVAAGTGFSAYPLDQQQEQVQTYMAEEVSTYLQETLGIGVGIANEAAERAVRERPWNRVVINGEEFVIEGDDRARLERRIAVRAELFVPSEFTGELLPDTELVRRYGREREMTPKEREQLAETGLEHKRMLDEKIDHDWKSSMHDIENRWFSNSDPLYGTIQDVMRGYSELDEARRSEVELTNEAFEFAIEQAKKRSTLTETERTKVFNIIRGVMFGTTDGVGQIDFKARRDAMERLEAEIPDFEKFREDFFESAFDDPELTPTYRLRQYLIESLVPYFDVALDNLSDHQYNLWARHEALQDNARAQVEWRRSLSRQDRGALAQSIRLVDREQTMLLRGRGEGDPVMMNLARFILYGAKPKDRRSIQLLKSVTDGNPYSGNVSPEGVQQLNSLLGQ